MEPVDDQDSIQSEIKRLEELSGLFRVSPVNKLQASWTGVLEGQLDPALFRDRIASERERFSGIYERFIKIYNIEAITGSIRDEMDRLHFSLTLYGKTLEEMESSLETYDPQVIGTGLGRLSQCVQSVVSSYKVFLNFKTKICPQCQSKNPVEDLKCQNCSTFFILTGEEIPLKFTSLAALSSTIPVPKGTFPLAGSLIEAYKNFKEYSSGSLTRRKYVEHLDWLITSCELSRRKLERAQYSVPPEALKYEDFRAAELLFDAIDSGRNALEKLRDKIFLDDPRDLSAEWNKLIQSVHMILQSKFPGGTGNEQ
ncbi:MAG: hypothetical protein RDV48_25680 [Candidatus Eremiobacteraeota bacterium]|nr:hypothetical protein [Candidatus Eremiobacteraeota bacterium]